MEDLRKKLNITIESPYWDAAYEQAVSEPEIPRWLTEPYLRNLHEKQVLPERIDDIVAAAKAVTEVADLVMLAKVLANIIAYEDPNSGEYVKRPTKEAFTAIELPKAPADCENTMPYDCIGLFPIIAHLERTWEVLVRRNIEMDIVAKTASYIAPFINYEPHVSFSELFFTLYPAFIYREELFIERLRFEIAPKTGYNIRVLANRNDEIAILMDKVNMHRTGQVLGAYGFEDEEGACFAEVVETDAYFEGYAVSKVTCLAEKTPTRFSKKEWRTVYQTGDPAVKVHIEAGPGFTKENCEKSFQRARSTIRNCFPEYNFKGFFTTTWLLSPELAPIIKENSNIDYFRKSFTLFPVGDQALDVFYYVYHKQVNSMEEVNIEELSEESSLSRGIKSQLQKGVYIHNGGGFILF